MRYRRCYCLFTWIQKRKWKLALASCFVFVLWALAMTYLSSEGKSTLEAEWDIEAALGSPDIPSEDFVLPRRDTTLYTPKSFCSTKGKATSMFVLFMVVSAPANLDARIAIRNGWKSYVIDNNDVLFFVGLPHTAEEVALLFDEAEDYDDLIIEDLEESFLNLTLKSLRMLKWVERNCGGVEFLVKIDDDFHLNLEKLLVILDSLSGEDSGRNLVGGDLRLSVKPIRETSSSFQKYTPHHLWPYSKFPDFIAGYFYVLGRRARRLIYRAAMKEPLFHLDDVFMTGIIANDVLGFNLTELPVLTGFWTPWMNLFTSSCDIQTDYIGIHFHMELFNYLECWQKFNSPVFTCSNWPLFTYCWFG